MDYLGRVLVRIGMIKRSIRIGCRPIVYTPSHHTVVGDSVEVVRVVVLVNVIVLWTELYAGSFAMINGPHAEDLQRSLFHSIRPFF